MEAESPIAACGWDVGGAHLKLARAAPDGTIVDVAQVPCPLWLGLAHLHAAIDRLGVRTGDGERHAVTMTGELADLFPDRPAGVAAIAGAMADRLGSAAVRIFAGPAGWCDAGDAGARATLVASANWLASGQAVAAALACDALLVDVGSTTTDIVRIAGGAVRYDGYADGERLRSGELVYAGVVRTPVAAVVDRVPFAGAWSGIAAELFATLGDVHVLTGELTIDGRFGPPADGRDWSVEACARRLARMVGEDVAPGADTGRWGALARHVALTHRDRLRVAIERRLSTGEGAAVTLVAAGIGRFAVRAVAATLGLACVDFAQVVPAVPAMRDAVSECAPAAALARAAARGLPR